MTDLLEFKGVGGARFSGHKSAANCQRSMYTPSSLILWLIGTKVNTAHVGTVYLTLANMWKLARDNEHKLRFDHGSTPQSAKSGHDADCP